MRSGAYFSLPRTIGQLARYGALGVAINLALYAVYLILTEIGLAPIAAATVCFLLGIPISLTIHRRFTFRTDEISIGRRVLFASGYIMGYFLQIGGLYLLYRIAGLPHQAAQFVAMVIVALFLFCFQKFLVFKT